jgi:uncharacterized membrane protein
VVRARAAFLLSLLLFAGAVVWAAIVLPDRVPVHWGSGGAADRVVSRDRAVAELVVIGAALALLLGGAAALVTRLPMSWINVPHKEYWSRPENRPELHRRLATDLWVIATATLLLLVVIVVQVVLVADDPDPRLGPLFWVAFVVYGVLVLGLAVNSALRRYRPEDGT